MFRYVIIAIQKAVSVRNSINKFKEAGFMNIKTLSKQKDRNPENKFKVTRRTFIKIGGAVAAAAICGFELRNLYAVDDDINPDPNAGDTGVQVIRTACMMCNAGCGLQVKVKDGIALKIEGNPFCPHTNDYSTAGTDAVLSDISEPDKYSGTPCARGNAGLKTLRGTPDSSKRASEKLTTDDTNYAAEAKSGDPANFGFKANRYVWIRGRDQISQITKRFNGSYGTVNHIEHSSLCNTNYSIPAKTTFTGPKSAKYSYMRVDLDNVEYLILLGTNPLEANVGTPYWARKLMALKANGGKLIVVDPFFTHTASKADKWIPIKPGTDLAMLMGIMRWILDNNRHQSNYLSIPNENTASSAGYKNYTDAAFLVKTVEGKGEGFLNASEAGLLKGVKQKK